MVSRSFFIYTLKKYNLKLQIKVFSFSQGIDIKNKASANSKQSNLLGRNFIKLLFHIGDFCFWISCCKML